MGLASSEPGWLGSRIAGAEIGSEPGDLTKAYAGLTSTKPRNQSLTLRAADLSLEFSLPMADAFVLAAARALRAELITSDTDLKSLRVL